MLVIYFVRDIISIVIKRFLIDKYISPFRELYGSKLIFGIRGGI